MRPLKALSCCFFPLLFLNKQWRMMDEIKTEKSEEAERLVSLQAPNKEVMSYYTPASHRQPLQWVSACLQYVCLCQCAAQLCFSGCSKCQLTFEATKKNISSEITWEAVAAWETLQSVCVKQKHIGPLDVCMCLCVVSVHGAYYSGRVVIILLMLKVQLPLKTLSSSK